VLSNPFLDKRYSSMAIHVHGVGGRRGRGGGGALRHDGRGEGSVNQDRFDVWSEIGSAASE
jgi:hypothetical protein